MSSVSSTRLAPTQEAGVTSGDILTAVARNMQISAHEQGVAFAAVRSDRTVQTWGCKEDGGDSGAVLLGLKK